MYTSLQKKFAYFDNVLSIFALKMKFLASDFSLDLTLRMTTRIAYAFVLDNG